MWIGLKAFSERPVGWLVQLLGSSNWSFLRHGPGSGLPPGSPGVPPGGADAPPTAPAGFGRTAKWLWPHKKWQKKKMTKAIQNMSFTPGHHDQNHTTLGLDHPVEFLEGALRSLWKARNAAFSITMYHPTRFHEMLWVLAAPTALLSTGTRV